MNISRRNLLRSIGAVLATVPFQRILAASPNSSSQLDSNFRYIYENAAHKDEFFEFLTNVFHLYPEKDIHQLIALTSKHYPSDKAIYKNLQTRISDIKPFLSELTYAVPALSKQKQVMAEQTVSLLYTEKRYEGYLELGSTGRYLDALEEQLDIVGDIHFISDRPATYSPPDMVDRGQIFKAGEYTHLNNYKPDIRKSIPNNSIDLVTVYIGFHHCPVELREEFIGSIRDVMKPGANLIIRDHDVNDEKMWKMVALAHDVFNMGTNETWSYNNQELRHFYSLKDLDTMLVKYGFESVGTRLYQPGDPTHNALMMYKKV